MVFANRGGRAEGGWLGTSRVPSGGSAGGADGATLNERSPHDGGHTYGVLAAVAAAAALANSIYPPNYGGTFAKKSGRVMAHLVTTAAGSRSVALGSSPQGRAMDRDSSKSDSDYEIALVDALCFVGASEAVAALTESAATLAAPAILTTPRSTSGVPVLCTVLPSLSTAAAVEEVAGGRVWGIGGKAIPCAKPTTVLADTSTSGGAGRAISHPEPSAGGIVRYKAAAAPTGLNLLPNEPTGHATAEVGAAEARTSAFGGGTSASAASLPAVALAVAPRLLAARALARPTATS